MTKMKDRSSRMYRLVPVFFALIQSWKDKRDKRRGILADQTDNPVIVPKVQCPLSNLQQYASSIKQWWNSSTVVAYKLQSTMPDSIYRKETKLRLFLRSAASPGEIYMHFSSCHDCRKFLLRKTAHHTDSHKVLAVTSRRHCLAALAANGCCYSVLLGHKNVWWPKPPLM